MHIHGTGMNLNAASLYSSAGAEKAAEAQRAAEVRKRLLAKAQSASIDVSPEESLMISRWLGSLPNQEPGETSGYDTTQHPYATDADSKRS
jgi:hypothetical protein